MPGTANRSNAGGRVGGGFHVVDRPMTQQGLGGIKGGAQGPGRLVQDSTFFQSELRQKINILTTEIARLNAEAENTSRENANQNTFEKRADLLAEELRELQGQLGDLNVLVDKLHTDSDLADIERHQMQLKSKNQWDSQVLDEIFMQRQQKENMVREIEKTIEEERTKSEAQINNLDPERRSAYYELKEQNAKFLVEIQRKQIELDDLATKTSTLQQEVRHDPIRQKTLALYEKVSSLRAKKMELEESLMAIDKDSGPQEKSRLLEQVKEDNQETSAMERKITELEEQSLRLKEMISQLDMDADSNQGERNSKYEELLKRDKEMQAFINAFDDKKKEAVDRNALAEKNIVSLLDKIKVGLAAEVSLKEDEHRELQGDLKFKEKEMKNSENTMDALNIGTNFCEPSLVEPLILLLERERRMQDLDKVNQLETKLHAELEHLREKISTQEKDLVRVANIEGVKKEAEQAKKKNIQERELLKQRRELLRHQVQQLAARYDGKRAQLNDNETYAQLGALEQRLKHHESNNFHLKEYIAAKSSESDYKGLIVETNKMVDEINNQLVKFYFKGEAKVDEAAEAASAGEEPQFVLLRPDPAVGIIGRQSTVLELVTALGPHLVSTEPFERANGTSLLSAVTQRVIDTVDANTSSVLLRFFLDRLHDQLSVAPILKVVYALLNNGIPADEALTIPERMFGELNIQNFPHGVRYDAYNIFMALIQKHASGIDLNVAASFNYWQR
ncbi:Intraflagellar transport protein 74 [Irineochytrium annulatum]|nr:Intraflagellar transport protein 74 [Irineochytrium annulatum]